MSNSYDLGAQGDKSIANSHLGSEPRKAECDSWKAERGKYDRADVVFSFPVYATTGVHDFSSNVAELRQVDVVDLVSDCLRVDESLIQNVQ